ncbi:MAG: TonB family protein, partial [Arcobacter sp.]|nr:TonB family protein [Arcobacter sp.]
ESKESKESKSEPIVQSKQQASQLVTQSSTHHENQKQINNTDEINKKNRYFSLLKQAIDSHKYYPQNALRRAIEADVEVKFIISSSGELISILAINGNKVFQASVKEAIESTFPFAPPKNLLNENTTLALVISYKIQD